MRSALPALLTAVCVVLSSVPVSALSVTWNTTALFDSGTKPPSGVGLDGGQTSVQTRTNNFAVGDDSLAALNALGDTFVTADADAQTWLWKAPPAGTNCGVAGSDLIGGGYMQMNNPGAIPGAVRRARIPYEQSPGTPGRSWSWDMLVGNQARASWYVLNQSWNATVVTPGTPCYLGDGSAYLNHSVGAGFNLNWVAGSTYSIYAWYTDGLNTSAGDLNETHCWSVTGSYANIWMSANLQLTVNGWQISLLDRASGAIIGLAACAPVSNVIDESLWYTIQGSGNPAGIQTDNFYYSTLDGVLPVLTQGYAWSPSTSYVNWTSPSTGSTTKVTAISVRADVHFGALLGLQLRNATTTLQVWGAWTEFSHTVTVSYSIMPAGPYYVRIFLGTNGGAGTPIVYSVSVTFLTAAAPPGPTANMLDYFWFLVFILIVGVVLMVAFILKRKRGGL